MKFITLSILLVIFFSCKTPKNQSAADINKKDSMITATIGDIPVPTDPITISGVKIIGNKMMLDVNYSGGCKDHSFEVIGSPNISKSLPPLRAIQLVHKANEDNCREYISKTLEIDITALAYKQEVGSVIYLTIDGWKERIEYVFE